MFSEEHVYVCSWPLGFVGQVINGSYGPGKKGWRSKWKRSGDSWFSLHSSLVTTSDIHFQSLFRAATCWSCFSHTTYIFISLSFPCICKDGHSPSPLNKTHIFTDARFLDLLLFACVLCKLQLMTQLWIRVCAINEHEKDSMDTVFYWSLQAADEKIALGTRNGSIFNL